MTVPLTFEIGDNMSSFLFNQYFLSSLVSQNGNQFMMKQPSPLLWVIIERPPSSSLSSSSSTFPYVLMTIIKPTFSACFHMKCKTITAVKIAKT